MRNPHVLSFTSGTISNFQDGIFINPDPWTMSRVVLQPLMNIQCKQKIAIVARHGGWACNASNLEGWGSRTISLRPTLETLQILSQKFKKCFFILKKAGDIAVVEHPSSIPSSPPKKKIILEEPSLSNWYNSINHALIH